ncbi:voltage-gated chloride channel family protein [Anaerocolumna sp. MB42-C2]|uniref:voltage-gated chloride channel family protein n=1 Tax=Anaerocolumna sp. MB42-C2 TaxID=3070997 RepID=UPI0027E0DB97|nr:voltage-gated chloride channel family protein [Anaerocolumna sp. MB42-C2]WMJ86781.1 voltage-gated chloride channel family protein [Anaerocolumna sp. MB42-C2]
MLALKKTLNNYKDVVLLGFIAILIGILVGAIDTLFGKVLLEITNIRSNHVFQLIPFLPLAGILIIFTYSKIGKNSIKGMSLIFSVGFEEEDTIPKRLVPLVMVSTWLTHLFGGSAGREGVAVQIGGTVAHSIGRRLSIRNSSKILLITGMSAGFAGLFQTPIAAIFFAMEVLTAGSIEYCALFPCIVASFVASYTSHALGLEKFSVNLNCSLDLNAYLVVKVVLLGILFGIIGGLFAHILNLSKKFFSKRINNPILRIFILGCILSVLLLLLHKGRYAGLGTNLIGASFFNDKIYGYDWLLKFLLTILTLSAGFQGGEVTPLFSIGSCLGAIVSSILGLPIEFAAALGYVAVFGSATNTILAPIFIGVEVFGYDYLPYFFVVSAIAYVFNGNKSIYSAQKILDDLN